MPSGTVRVLIPTYRPKEKDLQEALDGLLAQEFQDWQAVIHDDASDTDVETIVSPYLGDKRITLKRSDVRLGIGGNWNACLRLAKNAEFIAFLFQDDVWAPTYLKNAVSELERFETAAFVSMGHRYVYEGMEDVAPLYESVLTARKSIAPGVHRGSDILRSWIQAGLTPNIIGEPSFVVIRRHAMEKVGPFLPDMPQFLDVEAWTRLLSVGDCVFHHDDEGMFRVHRGGASAGNQEAGAGLFDRLRCLGLLISRLEGEDRRLARSARKKALRGMVGKFLRRLRERRKVSSQGSSELKSFVLRHPFEMLGAIVGYVMHGGK